MQHVNNTEIGSQLKKYKSLAAIVLLIAVFIGNALSIWRLAQMASIPPLMKVLQIDNVEKISQWLLWELFQLFSYFLASLISLIHSHHMWMQLWFDYFEWKKEPHTQNKTETNLKKLKKIMSKAVIWLNKAIVKIYWLFEEKNCKEEKLAANKIAIFLCMMHMIFVSNIANNVQN